MAERAAGIKYAPLRALGRPHERPSHNHRFKKRAIRITLPYGFDFSRAVTTSSVLADEMGLILTPGSSLANCAAIS
jgi:hypothetical protein